MDGRWLGIAAMALATLSLVSVGCGSGGGGGSAGLKGADYSSIRTMAGMYEMHLRDHQGRPPANEQEFRGFLATKQDTLHDFGLTVDKVFRSPRSGEPLEWVYGKKPPTSPGGMTYVAYEKTPVDGKRLVIATRGMYEQMDEATFRKVFPDVR